MLRNSIYRISFSKSLFHLPLQKASFFLWVLPFIFFGKFKNYGTRRKKCRAGNCHQRLLFFIQCLKSSSVYRRWMICPFPSSFACSVGFGGSAIAMVFSYFSDSFSGLSFFLKTLSSPTMFSLPLFEVKNKRSVIFVAAGSATVFMRVDAVAVGFFDGFPKFRMQPVHVVQKMRAFVRKI